jgi:hypothetical protein
MKHLMNAIDFKRILHVGLAVGMIALLTGCEEVNVAIDSALGLRSPVLSASTQTSPRELMPAAKRAPREEQSFERIAQAQTNPGATPKPAEPAAASPAPPGPEGQGKKRMPGQLSPAAASGEETRARDTFVMGRDPFEQPTEILPTECPPSMPLCRFDRSQLKLVGVIQVSDGHFKGMVEDPDGRGYFITTGMQIGGGTVTQVTSKGITLHLHRNRQDVLLPLFSELGGEF